MDAWDKEAQINKERETNLKNSNNSKKFQLPKQNKYLNYISLLYLVLLGLTNIHRNTEGY